MPGAAPLPLVHLVGSVPLDTAESNFYSRLGRATKPPAVHSRRHFPLIFFTTTFYPQDVEINKNSELKTDDIKPTGYDDAAIALCSTFRRFRNAGAIPSDVRFQVSLPTPLNAVSVWVDPKYAEAAEIQYEQRIISVLANIQANISPENLAIQWDLAVEMAHMEHAYGPFRSDFHFFKPSYSPVKEGIVDRLKRLVGAVDMKVTMDFHLCYDDFQHKYYFEPEDSSLLVDLINSVSANLIQHHSIGWFHIPVPKDRIDDACFEPLGRLKIVHETTLFWSCSCV